MSENIQEPSQTQSDVVAKLCERLEHLKDTKDDEIVEIVTKLSQHGSFTSLELKLRYLQARDNWFNEACEESSSSFDGVVSLYSRGLPMIFNEYKSLFGEDSHLFDSNRLQVSDIDSDKDDSAIINSWLLFRTSIFVESLEMYLKTVNHNGLQTPTSIADTIQKCFELTGCLSGIGFDFSCELRPLFCKALSEEIRTSIEHATTQFETIFADTVSKSVETLLLPVEDEILRISNMRPEQKIPKSIGDYPVFKVYCLHILDSLRWVESTASVLSPIGLCSETYSALNVSLTRVMKALSMVLNSDDNANHPILSRIAISFITEILPVIANYCEQLFPERLILNAIGLTKPEFKHICKTEPNSLTGMRLDLRQIAEPIKSVMPAIMQTIEGY